MPRPRKARHVCCNPAATYYKPQGIPMRDLEEVVLSMDGFEALRLVDAEGLPREEAAARMSISQSTLCRLLADARKIMAETITSGKALKIEGGDYIFKPSDKEKA